MAYKIEKNIQPARKTPKPKIEYEYPLLKMRVGDSFLIEGELCDNAGRNKIAKRVRAYLGYLAALKQSPDLLNRQYRAGLDPWNPDNKNSGKFVRVWRVK
jgi:hypothetical protein